MPRLLLMICCVSFVVCPAQDKWADSLRQGYATAANDTERVYALADISAAYGDNGANDSAIAYAHKAMLLAANFNGGKEVWLRGIALGYRELGLIYSHQANYPASIKNHLAALRIATLIGDKKSMGSALGNLGNIAYKQGDYPHALNYYLQARKVFEELKSKRGSLSVHNNIGLIYLHQKNFTAALASLNKGLAISREMNEPQAISGCYMYIGQVYKAQGRYKEALPYFLDALKVDEQDSSKHGMALNYGHLADIYAAEGNYEKARQNHLLALRFRQEVDDRHGQATSYNSIGRLLVKQGKAAEGKEWLQKGLQIGLAAGGKPDIRDSYAALYSADSLLAEQGQRRAWESALNFYKLHIAYRDSLVNEDNTRRTVQLEMQYEFDKKEETARLEQERKDAVAAAESRRQRIILLAISGLGLLVLGFALFAYRSFLQKKKAHIEISRQKHVIEEKQKEILDSIFYARRIQRSLLTSETYIARRLREMLRGS